MEKDIQIDDNLSKRSDSVLAAKSVGSFVKIDSISIDLDDANDENSTAGKCEHFSIRGYVSEIRKKNWKICWPFALDGNLEECDQKKTAIFPPLDAPKFRSWCCQNCLREIGSKNVAKGHGADLNIRGASNPKRTTAQMPSTTDAALPRSDFQPGQKSNIVVEKHSDAYTSIVRERSETHPSSRFTKKRNGEISSPTIIVNENGLDDYGSHDMPKLNSVETDVNSIKMQERRKHVKEAKKLDCNGKLCKPECESHVASGLELEIRGNNCWSKKSTQICETEYQSSAAAGEKPESINASGPPKARMFGETGCNATKVQTNNPLILDEFDYPSSENNEKSSGLHRKKGRKVRLLTELLCNNGDAKADSIRKEDSPSNMLNNASEAGSVSQDQVSPQKNARVHLSENKKRKLCEELGKEDQKVNDPEVMNMKVKNIRRDGETAHAIAGTGLEEDASARLSLQADLKNSWSGYGNERIPTVGKKKAKRSHDFEPWSPLAPSEENVPIEGLDKFETPSKGGNAAYGTSLRLMYDASTVRGIAQVPLHSSKQDPKSGFVKKKGKIPQSDTGPSTLLPTTGMLRKESITRKDAKFKRTGSGTVPFHLAEDASIEKGLDLSLNNSLPSQRYDGKRLPQPEDGFPSLSTWKDSTCKLDEFMRKNVEVNYLANLNKPSTSMANPSFDGGVHAEPSKKVYTYSMPVVNEKQNYSLQIEQGSSLIQQVDLSRASKNQNIIEVERNTVVPRRKHNSHQAEKMSEKGSIDDIPMEIVELMAKNQYERCRHESENDKHVLETPNKARNAQVMEHNQVHNMEDLRVLEEASQKRKAQARNAKIGTIKKNVVPLQPKPVDYFSYMNGNHFGMNRLDQMHCPTGFGPFSQSQKKPSPRGQFPAAGHSTCSCAQSCKWDGNIMGHGFPNSNLQSFACNTCQSIPQSKEEAGRLWSPVISAHMPFAYKNSQKSAALPSNARMLSLSSDPLQKGNANGDCDLSLNLNAPIFEKRNEAVGPETISRTTPEYPFSCKHNGTETHQSSMGSADLYSNETIPAMHLLSLMDAGMRSGSPLDMGGNPKCPKRPFPNDLNSKGYPGVDAGLYKATDAMNHSSSNSYGKNQLSEKSLDLFPTNPTFGASTSSFEHLKGFGRATDFMGQGSSSQKKEKIQRCISPAQNRGPRSQKSSGIDGGLGNNQTTIPGLNIAKGFLPVSGLFPLNYHTIATSRLHNLETHNVNGTMKPPKSSSEPSICCINRNPADFSTPDVGNGYMIRGEDLKIGKKTSSRKRHGLVKVDQQKRQRNTKFTTEKDRARN